MAHAQRHTKSGNALTLVVFADGNQITCTTSHLGGAAALLNRYKDDRTH